MIADVNAFALPIMAQREQERNRLASMAAPRPTFSPSSQYNALATYGGPTRAAAMASGGMDTDWLRYANQQATRNQPLSDRLVGALSFLPELGVTMEVFSGGQHGIGSGHPRVGSTRHDHGHAADVFFYKDGRRLDWSNPQDLPTFQEIVKRGRAAGLTGFGAGEGYMRPGSMHIGFGDEAVWGAGGKGANAPDWLRSAFYNTNPVQKEAPPSQPAPMESVTINDLLKLFS